MESLFRLDSNNPNEWEIIELQKNDLHSLEVSLPGVINYHNFTKNRDQVILLGGSYSEKLKNDLRGQIKEMNWQTLSVNAYSNNVFLFDPEEREIKLLNA